MEIGEWVLDNRKKMKWSRKTLAEVLDMSAPTIKGWETLRVKPGPYARMRLEQTFGTLPE